MSKSSKIMDEIRARLSLARIVAKTVSWDSRQTKASQGDYWACCPFHNEKSPSFHVLDKKGFYHCFGCNASGDVFKFVQETRGWGFKETLEYLAKEANVQLPEYSPEQAKKDEQHRGLVELTEAAASYFRIQLAAKSGTAAREYLSLRGISEKAQKLFEIGFAPNRRSDLFKHLIDVGHSAANIILAGLSAHPEDGGDPYDRFRNRIIFPIRNPRNQVIGFGGRALDPNARAKYLNSPETPIFTKGSCLYNHLNARNASSSEVPLIVSEGYLDVIALSEAGFKASVAPLGTAVTESQLFQIWKLSGHPVIALDGDQAGLSAARRIVNLALPFVDPSRTLRFCVLPENQDPDDVIRQQGKDHMRQMLDRALPLSEFLWWSETKERRIETAEQLAELQAALEAAVAKVKDPNLKKTYRRFVNNNIWEHYEKKSRAKRLSRHRGGTTDRPTQETLTTSLARSEADDAEWNRLHEAAVLAICLSNPSAVDDQCVQRLENLEIESSERGKILHSFLTRLETCGQDADVLKALVIDDVGEVSVAQIFASRHIRNIPSVRAPGNHEAARCTLNEELDRLASKREAEEEIKHFVEDMQKQEIGKGGDKRMCTAIIKRDELLRGQDHFDNSKYEVSEKSGLPIQKIELAKLNDLFNHPDSGS